MWGLNQRVVELVTIAEPSDLHAAINKAEKIEMARSFAATGQPGPKTVNLNRGRGGFIADMADLVQCKEQARCNSTMQWKHFNWLHSSRIKILDKKPLDKNQCWKCRGWGHWGKDCPSPYKVGSTRGRGSMMRGKRGGR